MNINPEDMSVMEWVDAMALLLEGDPPVQKLIRPEEWREWAGSLGQQSSLGRSDIPNPYLFDDWREWAQRFNSIVELS